MRRVEMLEADWLLMMLMMMEEKERLWGDSRTGLYNNLTRSRQSKRLTLKSSIHVWRMKIRITTDLRFRIKFAYQLTLVWS